MNLLYCYWGRKGGGAKYSEELLRSFLTLEHVDVFTSFSENAENFSNVAKLGKASCHIRTYENLFGFAMKTIYLPFILLKMASFIRKHRIQLVYIPMSHLWTLPLILLLKCLTLPHVLTVHDGQAHPGDNSWLHLFKAVEIKLSPLIVVLSDYVRSQLVNKGISEQKLIESVHGLLNYQNINSSPKEFMEAPFRFVFFGRIKKYKGIALLIDAFLELEDSYDDVVLEIYGQGDLTPYQPLIHQSRHIRIENRWVPDDEIYRIFETSCINVAPYIEASQSGTIPVACSCGIPTICSDIGGLSEQVVDGETGLVFKGIESSEKLYSAMESLYQDRERCKIFSKKCLEFSRKELSWTRISNVLYENIKDRLKIPLNRRNGLES